MARNSKDTRRRLASGDKDRDPTVQMHHLGGSAMVAGSSHSNGHHNNGGNGSNNGKSKHRRCPASAGRLGFWSSFGLTDSAAVTKALLVLLSVVSISVALYYQHLVHLREMTVRTPLNSPKMLSENSTSPLMDPDRYWGTYRSHLYFG